MKSKDYTRSQGQELAKRLHEPRRFMQVVTGARQVGKTTLVRQTLAQARIPHEYASTDLPTLQDHGWIIDQWETARTRLEREPNLDLVLVLDEVQKIPQWSGVVKWLWDHDAWHGIPLKVVLLGSSPLLMDKGLSESLAGRFETLHLPHWGFREMHDAFGWDWERYVFFGGYPGANDLVATEDRWREYVLNSVIEATVTRDVLLHTRVGKPSLLRLLLRLGCEHSSKIISHNKMLGGLHDAGNTTTLAHYLDLLEGAGLLAGLQKYHESSIRARRSIPKLQVFNTALMTALSGLSFDDARNDPAFWGRLVESAVGAHLVNAQASGRCAVHYWRENNMEVDFVVRSGPRALAIEVKSGRVPENIQGLTAFRKRHPTARGLVVGGRTVPVWNFLARPVDEWLNPDAGARTLPLFDG